MNTLNDIAHYWGNDLSASASGDLLSVGGTIRGQQRVLRRLMTCPADPANNLPADYPAHPDYGLGLPRYIGSNATAEEIESACIGQMRLEDCVANQPPPQATVTKITNGLFVNLSYTDAPSGSPVSLGFNVGG